MTTPKKGVFGTYEWAASNANCVVGCSHNCVYCYARTKAVSNGTKTAETWCDEIISKKAMSKVLVKKKGTIMFPTLHDITPSNLAACAVFLERLLSAGNDVLVVSKPHLDCIQFLCNAFTMYKDQILFRFTIGSSSDAVLRFWEPFAPAFEERIFALRYAFNAGYKTSVSCEPMLDNGIQIVVEEAEDYVTDAIWLGKANKLIERLTINGASEAVLQRGRLLESIQNDNNIKTLYEQYKDNPKIKWKESIKAVVGLEIPTEKGLDV